MKPVDCFLNTSCKTCLCAFQFLPSIWDSSSCTGHFIIQVILLESRHCIQRTWFALNKQKTRIFYWAFNRAYDPHKLKTESGELTRSLCFLNTLEYNGTFTKNTIQHFYNGDLLVDFQSLSVPQTQRAWKVEPVASSTKYLLKRCNCTSNYQAACG